MVSINKPENLSLHLNLSEEALRSSKSWRFSPGSKYCPVDVFRDAEIVYQCNASGGVIINPSPRTLKPRLCFTGNELLTSGTLKIPVSEQTVLDWTSYSFFVVEIVVQKEKCKEYLQGDLVKALGSAQTDGALDSVDIQSKTLEPLTQAQLPLYWVKDYKAVKSLIQQNLESLRIQMTNVQVFFKFLAANETEILPEFKNYTWARDNSIFNSNSVCKKLFTEALFADFKIEAEGRTFDCHKCFLAGRSPVFARMLDSKMSEVSTNVLKIEDMSAEGVEAFLKYVYSGSMEAAMTNPKICFELFRAAHKYEIKDMESVSLQILLFTEATYYDGDTTFEIFEYCSMNSKCSIVEGCGLLEKKALCVWKENMIEFQESGTLLNFIKSASPELTEKLVLNGLQFDTYIQTVEP